MSYILDALQKSTAEGNPVVAASLIQGNAKHRKQRLIGILIVAALLANVLVFAWQFSIGRIDPSQTVQSVQEAATSTALATSSQSARQSLPVSTGDGESSTNPPARRPLANTSSIPLDVTAEPMKTITVQDLPEPARLAFPEIEFSTHVYAEDPALRAIVANGQRLMEGDSFESLELIEITPEGVIFRFRDYLITISVLALWEEGA